MKNISVRDFMSSNVISVKPEDNIIEALRKLVKLGHSGTPVVDNTGELIGMLSEIDCLKEALMDGYFQGGGDRVADHMTSPVEAVQADDNILAAAELFINGRRRLPVMEDGKLIGIITRHDVAKALIYRIDNPHHGNN